MYVRAKTGGFTTWKSSLHLRNTTLKTSAHTVIVKSINQNVVTDRLSIANCWPRFPEIKI